METGRFFPSAVSFKSPVDASLSDPTAQFDRGCQTTHNRGQMAVLHSAEPEFECGYGTLDARLALDFPNYQNGI